MFGAPAAAQSAFSFGTPQPAAAQSAFSFGSAGKAPTSSFGFGSTSSQQTTVPGFGGFGAPQAAPAPSGSLFGGFSSTPAPAPSTGFGLSFGSSTTPSLFGGQQQQQSGGLFGKPAGQTSTGGFGMFGAPAQGIGQAVAPAIHPDTTYAELPEHYKRAIDELSQKMYQQRMIADSVSKADDKGIVGLEDGLRVLRSHVLAAENTQAAVKEESNALKEIAKDLPRKVETYGQWPVQQLVSPGGLRVVEALPSKIMWEQLKKFEQQLAEYTSDVEEVKKQLKLSSADDALDGRRSSSGSSRVDLARTLRLQHEALMRVAGHVATVHDGVDQVRQEFLGRLGGEDPFVAADRAEAEEERRLSKQVLKAQSQGPSHPAPTAATNTPSTSSIGGFGQPAPAIQTGGSLFGTSGGLPAPVLGGTHTAAPPSSGGLFGAAPPSSGGLFGGGFGSSLGGTGMGTPGGAFDPAGAGANKKKTKSRSQRK